MRYLGFKKGYNSQIWGGKVSCHRGLDVSLYRWQGIKFLSSSRGEDIVMWSRTKAIAVFDCWWQQMMMDMSRILLD